MYIGFKALGAFKLDEDKKKALIPRPGSELAVSKPKANQIVSRMTRDVLNRTRSLEVSQARFKLGDYEFREPDYRQILRWAEELEMAPEVVLEGLERGHPLQAWVSELESELVVEDGAIKELWWHPENFNFFPEVSEKGLIIRSLGFVDFEAKIPELDLSAVPELAKLSCGSNQLSELDLSPVPKLRSLNCVHNQLTELDLSTVPELEELSCRSNQLTELDLSPVPKLRSLNCDGNQLTQLDLSAVPVLEGLDCSSNQLIKLDLSAAPELESLDCRSNQLTELDLSGAPELEYLWCESNQLTELDLSLVPNLSYLECDSGVRIKNAPRGLKLDGGTIVSYAVEGPDKVQGVLNRTRSLEVSQARFKLGDYEFREPDYRQILRWAEELEMAPEALLEIFEAGQPTGQVFFFPEYEINLIVKDGAIERLLWYRDNLDLVEHRNQITELDLSALSELEELVCLGFQLTELDLSPVPKLTALDCSENQLTELDLSPVPKLTVLDCGNNQLTELDLAAVPKLTMLDCGNNQLTELDLSAVPELEWLYCSEKNQLTELDLSPVPKLTELGCRNYQLTELDLSPVPKLTVLDCGDNQLTELDLSAVPKLTELHCDSGVRIKNAPRGLEIFGGTIVSYADSGLEIDYFDDIPF